MDRVGAEKGGRGRRGTGANGGDGDIWQEGTEGRREYDGWERKGEGGSVFH